MINHLNGDNVPYSFRTLCGFFNVPHQYCETGPKVYHPYPRRLESLTICRCRYKGSTFSSVILRPWVLVQSRFEPATSCTAVRCSTNWANPGALRVIKKWQTPLYFRCTMYSLTMYCRWSNLHILIAEHAEHHTHIGKQRESMNYFSRGFHGQHACGCVHTMMMMMTRAVNKACNL